MGGCGWAAAGWGWEASAGQPALQGWQASSAAALPRARLRLCHPPAPSPPHTHLAVDSDPGAAPRGAQAGDVISKLVGIYGGKEQLIGEYR